MSTFESSPLLEEFLEAKRLGLKFAGSPASPRTITTYRQQLKRLENYAGKPLHDITADDVEKAIEKSVDEKLSASYRNLMLSAGRGFYDWAIRNRKALVTQINPFTGIRMNKRVRETEPRGITDQQFHRIIKAMKDIDEENVANALSSGPQGSNMPWVNDDSRLPRKILPVKLMYYGGLRITEAVSLKIDNVLDDGIIVEGKGSKERFVPLPKPLLRELADYITDHSEDDTYVFTPMRTAKYKEGSHLHPTRAHAPFHEAVKRAGLPDWISPHSLRHSFGQRAYDRTGQLEVVQDLLGHDNIETTRIYAKNRREDIKRKAANIWNN